MDIGKQGTTVKFASLPIFKFACVILVTDGVKRPTFIQATVVRYISPRVQIFKHALGHTVLWKCSQISFRPSLHISRTMKLSLVFIMFLAHGVSALNETLHYFSDHYNLSTTVTLSPHQERNLQRRKSSTVSFYAMGDAPYSVHEMAIFPKQIAKLDPDRADFAIHLGDMQDRTKHCEQRNYRDMKRLLERSALPMFIIPGTYGRNL